jgi:hypothetical protein
MDRSISVPIELEVRTDSKYSVISSGRHISERVASGVRTSNWITDRRQSWIFLAVGAFRTVTFEVEGHSFDVSWSESTPIDPQLVAKAEPHRIVKFYQQTFGHSGPPSFRLIVFPDESLQRFAIDGLIGLSREGYPATDSEYLRTVLAHEMAHYWWGDVVQASGPSAGWLAEGFAEYSRHLYEMSIGAPGLPWSFRNLAVVSRFADADPVPISADPARVPPEIAYQKGVFVLRMLGDEIGDDTLRRALRAFVQMADSQAVTAREFEQIVEREAGRSLDTFFRQWLDRARGPILNLDSVTVESRAGAYVIRGTLVQDGPAYDLAVPIALLLKNGDTIVSTVRTNRTRTEFRLDANDTPEKLIIDPEFRIFKWYPPARLPVTLADAWRSLGTGAPRLVFGDDIDAQTQARVSLFLRARFPRLVTNRPDDDGGSAILVGTPAARLRLERAAHIDHPPPGTLQAFVMRSAHDPAQVLIGIEGDWPEQLPEIIPQAALTFVRYRQGAIVSAISAGLTATSLQVQAAPGR